MLDLSLIGPRSLHTLDTVVTELATRAEISTRSILVIDAASRDLLHRALGYQSVLRSTTDLDVGLAIDDWEALQPVRAAFSRIGHSGIRFRIGGVPVDVVPFGDIESPPGEVAPPNRDEHLVVFGFAETFRHAVDLSLPSGHVVRLPRPAGYAVMKISAWLIRGPAGDDRDAEDLVHVIRWYQESEAVINRLYETTDGLRCLEDSDYDLGLAAVRLLGADIRDTLDSDRFADLARRFRDSDGEDLSHRLARSSQASYQAETGTQLEVLATIFR